MTVPKLRQYREELNPKVSQDAFAREADMVVATYAHIERGRPTTYKKATKILETLNKLRVTQGLAPLALDDLGINIA